MPVKSLKFEGEVRPLFRSIPKRAVALYLLSVPFYAQDRPVLSGKLPVRSVVLFKNGVGYFEHAGSVHGNQSVAISLTSGQLNDVLKSLTVLDSGGGHITSVAYGTSQPVSRELGDLGLAIGPSSPLAEVLSAVRGARVEVRSGAVIVSGNLLSVDHKTRISGGAAQDVNYVSILSPAGELKTVELSPASSVRFLDPTLTEKLHRYLSLISSERDSDVRTMVISDQGVGDRNLSVGFISEVPVWKSTYRLILDSQSAKEPLLQGWAIVDNVNGEDWNNVQLSLVAGAPQSFVQNLSQPYYVERPTVPLPSTVSTRPQTYQSTLLPGPAQLTGTVTDPTGSAISGAVVKVFDASNSLLTQTSSDSKGAYAILSLPDGTIRLEISAPGFVAANIQDLTASMNQPIQQNVQLQIGNSAQTVLVTGSAQQSILGSNGNLGRGSSLGIRTSGSGDGLGPGSWGGTAGGFYRADAAKSQFQAAADSEALGDLFEYKLKEPITILKGRSALVPIAQASVKAEKVSVWNDRNALPRPQRAVWIANSTGLTLDGGSVSVIEDGAFTGEGITDPIRPGEKRLLSFATDLAVNASSRIGSTTQRVRRVVIEKGLMTQRTEIREKKIYTFRNEDSSPRTIVVEHPVRSGYELKSAIRPVETTRDWMRFRVAVEPKQTASLTVEEARSTEATYALTNITPDQITVLVNQHSVNDAIQRSLRAILSQKDAIAALQSGKSEREEEMRKIFDDQQRLRENIKALRGTPEERSLLQRYTDQLNTQETRLGVLRAEVAQLAQRIAAGNDQLAKSIQGLAFDVEL